MGHAFAALKAAQAADRFLLRIEDIDTTRCREEFVTAIFDDLRWLGLSWEEPVLRQTTRFAAYHAALETLDKQGLLYPCFCTRKDIADEIARAADAPHGPEGALYPGTCRHLPDTERKNRMTSGEAYALRLDVGKAAGQTGPLSFSEQGRGPNGEHGLIAAQPELFGDIVLARKETPSSYHLAVVVDDAFQGVTLVTRGHDLFAAAHVQRLLQRLLGLPAPSYAHHRLILDEHGKKFSKRDSAVTLRARRDTGARASDIFALLGGLMP